MKCGIELLVGLLISRFTTSTVSLAVQELDDSHIGRFSFARQEDIVRVSI